MSGIYGLTSYRPGNGNAFMQIAIADDGANDFPFYYDANTNAWVRYNVALTSASKTEFANFLDYLFMVNYSNVTYSFDGTTWSTSTNVTDAPKAKYAKVYNARLYLGNVDVVGTAYPSRVYFSSYPTSAEAITWDTTNDWFRVNSNDGDVITGLGTNSNRLLIFKENSLWIYNEDNLFQISASPGTNSQRSVQNLYGWTLFFHRTGIWGFDGANVKLFSRAIQPFIDGISSDNIWDVCSFVWKDHYIAYVGTVSNSKENISITNCYLDYDISQNNWSVGSLRHDILVVSDYLDDTTELTYDQSDIDYDDPNVAYSGSPDAPPRTFIGDVSSNVYEWNRGRADHNLLTPMEINTIHYFPGNPDTYKIFKRLLVRSKYGTSIQVGYKIDFGQPRTFGQIQNNEHEFKFPAGTRGKSIQFIFNEVISGEPPELEGFSLYFSDTG